MSFVPFGFSFLVDCDVALLKFARTSSQLFPVRIPAVCMFLNSGIPMILQPRSWLHCGAGVSSVDIFFFKCQKIEDRKIVALRRLEGK